MIKEIRQIFRAINIHPLASRHRLRAYAHFFKWQIGQFFYPGKRTILFVGNTFFVASKGMSGITGNIYCGLHEFNDMGFLLHFLRKEDVFFDVGANVGSYTLLASGVCGAHTIAFEPAPSTFQILKENVQINRLEGITTLLNAAAGAQNGQLHFTTSYDTINHVVKENDLIQDGSETISVDALTVDSIFSNNFCSACLLKVDAEGFETEVLNGMDLTLADDRVKAIIIELNGSGDRYGYDESEIHKKLNHFGFQPYLYNPFDRVISTCAELVGHGNIIFIRDLAFVSERVNAARKIKLFSEEF